MPCTQAVTTVAQDVAVLPSPGRKLNSAFSAGQQQIHIWLSSTLSVSAHVVRVSKAAVMFTRHSLDDSQVRRHSDGPSHSM